MSFSKILKYGFFVFLAASMAPSIYYFFIEQKKVANPDNVFVRLVKIGGAGDAGPNISMILSHQPYVEEIQNAAEDARIKAIVLSIDSGGGAAGSSELIARAIESAREKKPVISLIANVCASGAYWIASASNKIICPAGAAVGSIGVLMMPKFTINKALAKYDISVKDISAGKYKSAGTPWKELTQDDQRYLENIVNEGYKVFTTAVARNRNLSIKDQTAWAEGKIFFGEKALELGLVDQIGGHKELEDSILKLLNLTGKKKIFYEKAPRPTKLALILGQSTDVGVWHDDQAPHTGLLDSLIRSFAKELVGQARTALTADQTPQIISKI